MSTLIIGGAFVVALLAIIGLVFLLRSEPNGSAITAQPAMQAKPETTAAPVAVAQLATPQASLPQRPVMAQRTAPVTQKLPLHLEEQLSALHEEEAFPVSNGQFHELSAQLSILHEQAQEFEHRLSVLTEMIRPIEHTQGDQISFEAETYTPHDTNR